MQINVTQEIIDKGGKGGKSNCSSCPIALAIREQTEFKAAEVGHDIWLTSILSEKPRHLPSEATFFIERFDDGKPVQPFSFELDLGDLEAARVD